MYTNIYYIINILQHPCVRYRVQYIFLPLYD